MARRSNKLRSGDRKPQLAFNRGVVSSRGLARVDLERISMSAERHENYIPRVLGSMMLRPGTEYLANTYSDNQARTVPFVFSENDKALIELTTGKARVLIDGAVITRPAVTTAITNPDFDADHSGWTDNDEGASVSAWENHAVFGGVLGLVGTGTDSAIRTQSVTTVETGVEHALNIDVSIGKIMLRVGSTDGDDDYISETYLGAGNHSLALTPTGNFWIQVSNVETSKSYISSIDIAASGAMVIDTPWATTPTLDLDNLRWQQSGDVLYVACDGCKQMKIERRAASSWSVVQYIPDDGPFRTQNVSKTTISTNLLSGYATLTASKAIFKEEHATNGTLFRVASAGQTVTKVISAQNTFSDTVRVVGGGSARLLLISVTGASFDATVTLQFSVGVDTGPWNDISPNYTVPTTETYDDQQEDQIIYYRIGVKTGDFGVNNATVSLTNAAGSIQGIARVDEFTSETVVKATVLQDFGSTDASADWWEGAWSEHRGYPTEVNLHEGRLWWFGRDKVTGSVSDGYETFDDNIEGDSGPIQRSVGTGPHDVIQWSLSLNRLMFGTAHNSANVAAAKVDGNSPHSAQSSAFDEPLTPSNFNIKQPGTKGLFVDTSALRLYELAFNAQSYSYDPIDLSVFAPDHNLPGIIRIVVQHKPEVRVHCLRSDGTVGMLVYDRLENVICWLDITVADDAVNSFGVIEDIAVLPGATEDEVYYTVKRTFKLNDPERHITKWALESEAVGGVANKIADSFVDYDGVATTTITGLDHLESETVVVWADGAYVGTNTVSSGSITLATAASRVIVGLPYDAYWKGSKFSNAAGTNLLERGKVNKIGFLAENLHHQGVQYGPDFDNLYDLPAVEAGALVAEDTIHATYHEDDFAFGGEWSPDSRICLKSSAPKPATLLAMIVEYEDVD